MFLGIEIGGTKLQVGIGAGDGGPLAALARSEVEPSAGATGIRAEIERLALPLLAAHAVRAVGVGFGGPLDVASGRTVKSHHIAGWDDFPLVDWCQSSFGVPTVVSNDADVAGLAEARFGAGRGQNPVFYVTIGTGIGGGLIVGGQIYRGSGVGAAELGHLRPGLNADRPEWNVESLASGWGIAASAQARLAGPISHKLTPLMRSLAPLSDDDVREHLIQVEEVDERDAADLLERCGGHADQLTARHVGQAAAAHNLLAQDVLARAWQALGWGLAQMITLVAPQAVVIGGGVSLLGESLLFVPLRRQVARFVFPPFQGSYRIVPAELGEAVVIHGALALAADASAAQ